jgi:hypothetical protein
VPGEVNFYLYIPAETKARDAAQTLEDQGYSVTVKPGADDTNWLALAAKAVSDDDLDAAEEQLVELAESLGGEFDGYDRPT